MLTVSMSTKPSCHTVRSEWANYDSIFLNLPHLPSTKLNSYRLDARRLSVHGLGQPVAELVGERRRVCGLLGLSAPSVVIRHGAGRSRLPAAPHPRFAARLRPSGYAADSRRPAGRRPVVPVIPHAALSPLLPAGALCRHPGPAPLLRRHDALRMTPPLPKSRTTSLSSCVNRSPTPETRTKGWKRRQESPRKENPGAKGPESGVTHVVKKKRKRKRRHGDRYTAIKL